MVKALVMMACAMGLVMGAAGCEEKGKVDTSRLVKAFEGSGPEMKANAEKVASAVKAGNWTGAMEGLKELGREAKLTEEQKAAVKDVLAQVQAQVKAAVGQGAQEAQKAAEDLKKSLGGN